jgi:hypothetical protein
LRQSSAALIDEKDVAMPSNRSDDLQAKTVRA